MNNNFDTIKSWLPYIKEDQPREGIRAALAAIEAEAPTHHAHQWIRTGAMAPGEARCIECGEWRVTLGEKRHEQL